MTKIKNNKKSAAAALGFEITSACGRVYFVTLDSVADDYASYLVQVDSTLDLAAAKVQALSDESALETWFCEQFNWYSVVQYGKVVKEPGNDMVLDALNSVRDNGHAPGHEYVRRAAPEVAAGASGGESPTAKQLLALRRAVKPFALLAAQFEGCPPTDLLVPGLPLTVGDLVAANRALS